MIYNGLIYLPKHRTAAWLSLDHLHDRPSAIEVIITWWRHQMETCYWPFVTGEFPSQRPVTQSFDVFFDLRLYREAGDLRRHRAHYDVIVMKNADDIGRWAQQSPIKEEQLIYVKYFRKTHIRITYIRTLATGVAVPYNVSLPTNIVFPYISTERRWLFEVSTCNMIDPPAGWNGYILKQYYSFGWT